MDKNNDGISVEKKFKKKKNKLGRGLSALVDQSTSRIDKASIIEVPVPNSSMIDIDQSADSDLTNDPHLSTSERVLELDVEDIVPNPYQPRRAFREEAIEELAESIKIHGLIQPITVRLNSEQGSNARYELVAGERRWRATQHAKISKIKAILVDIDHSTSAQHAMIENVQREDLNPIERAVGYQSLISEFGFTQEEIAKQVGLSRSSITNLLRLLDLESSIQTMLINGALSVGHGKALLGFNHLDARLEIATQAIEEGWSVRTLETIIQRMNSAVDQNDEPKEHQEDSSTNRLSSIIQNLEKQLSDQLSTQVKLRTNKDGTKGSVTIEFYDLDHFDGLMEKLGIQAIDPN